jgi:hypothetical protein
MGWQPTILTMSANLHLSLLHVTVQLNSQFPLLCFVCSVEHKAQPSSLYIFFFIPHTVNKFKMKYITLIIKNISM